MVYNFGLKRYETIFNVFGLKKAFDAFKEEPFEYRGL